MLCKETHDAVIRLAPPLIIGQEDLAWAVAQVRAAFSK
jgi:ornithine--oxo-acid transaminase